MYSDMSIRIKDSSESNIKRESTFANWVFPTPVGPRNINEPMGLFGSLSPARFRLMARDTRTIASSWPMTFPSKSSFIRANFPDSFSAIRCTGMPVIMETTSPTWSTVTVTRLFLLSSSHWIFAFSKRSFNVRSVSRNRAASSYRWERTTRTFSSLIFSISSSTCKISSGTVMLFKWTREPTSSMASIAMSGRWRSVM